MTIPPEIEAGAIILMGLKSLLEVSKFAAEWKSRKESAEKREVSVTPEMVTRPELDEVKTTINQMREQLQAFNSDAENRALHLHNRVNPLLDRTGEMIGRMDAFTTSFDNFTKLIVSMNQMALVQTATNQAAAAAHK